MEKTLLRLVKKIFDTPGGQPRPGGWLYFAAILITAALLLPPALLRPLQSPDEGRYAEVARQAYVSGDWLTPQLNGVPHLTKSPFYTDLVSLAYRVCGVTPFAPRLVSALAFLAALLATMRWAERRAGRHAAALCALLTLTMVQPVGGGQMGDLNMLLTCFLTLGMLWLFDALEAPPGRLGAWCLGWSFLGLAFFVKGPPALFIPTGTLVLYRWLSGRPFGKSARWWLGGVAIFCLFAFPWYVWLLAVYGRRLWDFWRSDIVQRTSMNKRGGKPAYYYFFYLAVFMALSSGWGVFMLTRLVRAMRWRKKAGGWLAWPRAGAAAARALPPAEQWLLSWLVFTLTVFSAMRANMITYIQPAYPAAALLLTLYLLRQKPRPELIRTVSGLALFAGALTLAVAWGVPLTLWTLVRTHPENVVRNREDIAYNVLARTMMNYPRQDWTLVQCFSYEPFFCFLTKRTALLCEHEIHPTWPAPAELRLTREQLRQRLREGRPMMLLVPANRKRRLFPENGQHAPSEPLPGLRELARGSNLILFSNVP